MNNYVTSMRTTDGSVIKLECHDALPSTSRLAKEYAKINYPDRYVVFSEARKKTNEKGKSVVEKGVFMSLILRPSIFPSQAGLLSALSTVAFTTALQAHTTKEIGIGWVSDVYCNGRLFGKVTIEGKLDNHTTYEYIIISFSATLTDEDFPPRMTDLVKQVFESDSSSIALIVAKNILNAFFTLYPNLKTGAKFMDLYSKRFILRGQKIKRLTNGKKETCKVLGINMENCSLMVEDSNKKVITVTKPTSVIIPKKIKLK